MDKLKDYLIKYRGAIIGGIVSVVALLLNFHKILICILIVVAGIVIGNYVQHNKEFVKEKIKELIDKL